MDLKVLLSIGPSPFGPIPSHLIRFSCSKGEKSFLYDIKEMKYCILTAFIAINGVLAAMAPPTATQSVKAVATTKPAMVWRAKTSEIPGPQVAPVVAPVAVQPQVATPTAPEVAQPQPQAAPVVSQPQRQVAPLVAPVVTQPPTAIPTVAIPAPVQAAPVSPRNANPMPVVAPEVKKPSTAPMNQPQAATVVLSPGGPLTPVTGAPSKASSLPLLPKIDMEMLMKNKQRVAPKEPVKNLDPNIGKKVDPTPMAGISSDLIRAHLGKNGPPTPPSGAPPKLDLNKDPKEPQKKPFNKRCKCYCEGDEAEPNPPRHAPRRHARYIRPRRSYRICEDDCYEYVPRRSRCKEVEEVESSEGRDCYMHCK